MDRIMPRGPWRRVVWACCGGETSARAALYLRKHDLANVRALRGSIRQ